MNDVQAYPYKCTYCGRSGRYRARIMGIVLDYRCPHDGARLIVQEPMVRIEETETVSVGGVGEAVIEFEHKLSSAIVNKLKSVSTIFNQ